MVYQAPSQPPPDRLPSPHFRRERPPRQRRRTARPRRPARNTRRVRPHPPPAIPTRSQAHARPRPPGPARRDRHHRAAARPHRPRRRTARRAQALDPRLRPAHAGRALPARRDPIDTFRYGLLSGFRRIAAYRALAETGLAEKFAPPSPPSCARPPTAPPASPPWSRRTRSRADLSPWEKGRIAVVARDQGVFATIEAAVDRLYPAADATRRSRLRSIARLAKSLEGALTAPEKFSDRQLLRIANACRNGFTTIVQTALEQSSCACTSRAPVGAAPADPHGVRALHPRRPELRQPAPTAPAAAAPAASSVPRPAT